MRTRANAPVKLRLRPGLVLPGLMLLVGSVSVSAQALLAPSLADDVIAERGDIELTLTDMDVKVRTMPAELRAGYLGESDRAARMIDTMLLTKQIAAQARELGIDKEPNFLEELDLAKTELLARTLIERHVEQSPVPNVDALAKERYLSDPEAQRPPPRIDVSHILVDTDGLDEELANTMIATALAKVKAGEAMTEVVKEMNHPKVSTQVIQTVDLSRMDGQFAAAVEGMSKVGEVAGPIRSRFGLHVIQIERYDVAPLPTFEQVKEKLTVSLQAEAKENARKAFLASFSKQDVALNGEVVSSLRTRYLAADGSALVNDPAPTPKP